MYETLEYNPVFSTFQGRLYLTHTSNTSGSWATEDFTIATGSTASFNAPNYTSIKTDSNNAYHIGYSYYGVVYATNNSGSWGNTVVDSASNVGRYSYVSIAVDSNNKAHMSYYDSGNYALKYATNSSGAWVVSTIDNNGAVGKFTSIAVDSNNKVHIAYYDSTNSAIKYATNLSGSWVTYTISNKGNGTPYTSIAVDSSNHVHISFSYNCHLYYASNASGTWAVSTVDSTGCVGDYSSIAVDSAGTVHISYYDNTNRSLKYAYGSPDAMSNIVSVSKSGSGNGIVTSAPAGISCGGTCNASFTTGTSVTLTASPDSVSTFTGWSGGGCTGTGTCTVTMSSAQNVTATFTVLSCTYSLNNQQTTADGLGATGTVSITAASGCDWTASPSASWITITSGATGSGNGTVNYSVSANTTGSARTGTITIADQTFTITQAYIPTYSNYVDIVQKFYIGYYQRPADPVGLIYWAARLNASGGDFKQIIEAFANSPESQTLYGNITSDNISTVVNNIYLALLSRPAEPEGLNWWVSAFNAHQFTPATIMLNVLYAAAPGLDLQSVNNKLTAANLFTRTIDPELDGKNLQATYDGDADNANARQFLAFVTSSSSTVPTQSWTTNYIQTYIANLADSILIPAEVTATRSYACIKIMWTAIASATSYNIYWSNSAGVTKYNGTKLASTSSTYTWHNDLPNSATYYYVVTAVNGAGESGDSVIVSSTTLPSLVNVCGYCNFNSDCVSGASCASFSFGGKRCATMSTIFCN